MYDVCARARASCIGGIHTNGEMRLGRRRMENNNNNRTASVAARCVAAACVLMAAASGGPGTAHGARVLAVETVLARSHWNFMKGVLLALADRGHRVTVYTPFPDASSATVNYTEVDTSAHFDAGLVAVNMDGTVVVPLFRRLSFLLPFMVRGSRLTCDVTDRLLADRGARDDDAYDLFLTEPLSSECVSHAARRLAVPLVYTVPAPLLPWTETAAFGHYANPAYASHLLSEWSVPDTFYRRAYNAGLYLYTVYLHRRATHAAASAEPRHYDDAAAPPVTPSLVFVNTHHVTEPSRPVPANRVDVGGIHLRKKPAPLPADILEFIEDSPHGVILFSLGTVVALSSLPEHIQKELKDALAEIPQRVLVKYEGEMKDKPKNVMTRKWLPQRDILLHPKVKLFIGHGGISGVYEAVDAGVPVLGFPMFYDQPRNIDNLVSAGMAISMDLFSVTKRAFLSAINDMVDNNETYWKNAKIVSERFKDRPMSPAESVVYWTEYVIRHKGAPHLKSKALDLTWYQYLLLDVIAAALSVILLALYVAYAAFKRAKKIVFKSFSKPKAE